jgi:hypothetical protein
MNLQESHYHEIIIFNSFTFSYILFYICLSNTKNDEQCKNVFSIKDLEPSGIKAHTISYLEKKIQCPSTYANRY